MAAHQVTATANANVAVTSPIRHHRMSSHDCMSRSGVSSRRTWLSSGFARRYDGSGASTPTIDRSRTRSTCASPRATYAVPTRTARPRPATITVLTPSATPATTSTRLGSASRNAVNA